MKLSKDQKSVLLHRIAQIAARLPKYPPGHECFEKVHKKWAERGREFMLNVVGANPGEFVKLNGAYPELDREKLKAVQSKFEAKHPEPKAPAKESMVRVSFITLADDRYNRDIDIPRSRAAPFEQLAVRLEHLVLAGSGEDFLKAIAEFESKAAV